MYLLHNPRVELWGPMGETMKDAWTIDALRKELRRFEAELRAAGKAETTI
jgi:hypothetical protein